MNGFTTYRIACQTNAEALDKVAKNNRAASSQARNGFNVRRRIATALVSIASRIQPGLHCELPRPIRPATA